MIGLGHLIPTLLLASGTPAALDATAIPEAYDRCLHDHAAEAVKSSKSVVEATDFLTGYLCGAELEAWQRAALDAQMAENVAINRRNRECLVAAKGDQNAAMACGDSMQIVRFSLDLMQGEPLHPHELARPF